MRRILKNITMSDINLTVGGFTIPANNQVEIARQNYGLIGNENSILELEPYILSGDIVVSDGENDLSVRVGIGLLRSDEIVINEYYTLTQDDGILMGNGQSLYLHDESWHYDDDAIEDDEPTEE